MLKKAAAGFPRGGFLVSAEASLGAAGWSSPVARQAHNLKVVGSNPTPATTMLQGSQQQRAQV